MEAEKQMSDQRRDGQRPYILTLVITIHLLSLVNMPLAWGLAVEKGEAKKIIVKNNSATMYQHKNYYTTLSSGPIGSAGIPTAISLGDTVLVKDKQLTAKHIFWTRYLERAEWQSKVLVEAGSVTCVIVQTLDDLPDKDEDRWRDRLWVHVSDCQVVE
jgi:hypothetical protein